METKAFKNDSIFEGWKEFQNQRGDWFRAEYKGCGIWVFYRVIVDIFGREAFLYLGTVLAPGQASCATIYSGYDDDGACAGWDEED